MRPVRFRVTSRGTKAHLRGGLGQPEGDDQSQSDKNQQQEGGQADPERLVLEVGRSPVLQTHPR